MCLLYCVTQKYFSECPGQESIPEVPNAFRNNVLLLLGSLEFRLHNIEYCGWHLAVPVEDPSFLFKKKNPFLVFTSWVLIQFGLYFFHDKVCINILKRCGTVKCFHYLYDRFEHLFESISRHLQKQSGFVAPEHIPIRAIKAVYRARKKRISHTEVWCLFQGGQKSFDSFTSSSA